METNYVYLAGPMSGVDVKRANAWRRDLLKAWEWEKLTNPSFRYDDGVHNVTFLDPMRGLTETTGKIDAFGAFPATARAALHRAMLDIRRAQLIVVGGLDISPTVSIGTMMEMGMGHYLGKPMIVQGGVLAGTPYQHPWVTLGKVFRSSNAKETVQQIAYFLRDGTISEPMKPEPSYGFRKSGEGGNVVTLDQPAKAQPNPIPHHPLVGGLGIDRGIREDEHPIYPTPAKDASCGND